MHARVTGSWASTTTLDRRLLLLDSRAILGWQHVSYRSTFHWNSSECIAWGFEQVGGIVCPNISFHHYHVPPSVSLYGSGSPLAEGLEFYSVITLVSCVDELCHPHVRHSHRVPRVDRVMALAQFHLEREAFSCPAAVGEVDRKTPGNVITSVDALWLRLYLKRISLHPSHVVCVCLTNRLCESAVWDCSITRLCSFIRMFPLM